MLAFAHVLVEASQLKFLGGILVLDPSGDPQEFRCTSAIHPTSLQQILWGERLQRYIMGELLLLPLVRSLQLPVDLILVQREEFLAARSKVGEPLLMVGREGGDSVDGRDSDRIAINIPSTNGPEQVIFLRCQPGYEEDLEVGRQLISQFIEMCYPLEPFQRIEQALKLLKPKLEGSSRAS